MSHDHEEEHHGHDAHHEENHGGHDSHDFNGHGDGHDDEHGHDGEHDGGGHDDHHEGHGDSHEDLFEAEEEIDEAGTILPAGTINDITPDFTNPEIDIAEQFPLSDTFAVDHNPGTTVFDLTYSKLKDINLSFKPILTLEQLRSPGFKDVFLEREYSPLSAFSLFVNRYIKRKKHVEYARIPRSPSIQIQKPVERTLNSVDIRNFEENIGLSNGSVLKRSDIYRLTPPFGLQFKRYIIHEWKFLFKITAGIFLFFSISVGMLIGSLALTRYHLISGITQLKSVRPTMDASIAQNQILSAASHFSLAQIFGKSAYIVRIFTYEDEMNQVIHATEGFAAIRKTLEMVDSIRTKFIQEEYPVYTGDYLSYSLLTNKESKYTDFILRHSVDFKQIQSFLLYAEYRFSSISSGGLISSENTENINRGLEWFKKILGAFEFIDKNSTALLSLAGNERPMKYLLLNQNKDEIRANGGFPGSAIEFEIYKGRLQNHTKRDIYYYDWHLYPYAETPPPGISEITKAYGIRDANYEPDFADSFITINRFFEKSGGATLDGAFGIHQGLVEEILKITGPVSVTGVTEPFTDKNFSRNMSILVETEFGRKNSPKDILFTFMDSLVGVIHSQGLYTEVLSLVESQITSGQIVGYAREEEAEKFIKQLQQKPIYLQGENFLEPIFTSISGNKSDRYMQRDFTLTSTATGECTLINSLQIKSTHTFGPNEERIIRDTFTSLSIDSKSIQNELTIQGKGQNKQFVRLIVPKNSQLITTNTKKIDRITSNPTYDLFTFFIDTALAETSLVTIAYQVPQMCGTPTLFGVQPGLTNYTFTQK